MSMQKFGVVSLFGITFLGYLVLLGAMLLGGVSSYEVDANLLAQDVGQWYAYYPPSAL